MDKIRFTGFNGFGQFGCSPDVNTNFREFGGVAASSYREKVCCCWEYNAFAIDSQLHLFGCVNGNVSQSRTISFEAKVKTVVANDRLCIVLLDNGFAYKLNPKTLEVKEINQTIIGKSKESTKTIFGTPSDLSSSEKTALPNDEIISHVAAGRSFSVGITNMNHVYNIPMRIWTYPKHVRIKKVCCGNEHCLILTANGDVYAFGSSSRGQLGSGKLSFEETPVLVEALAGIKIIDIAAGGWHSAAVSSFGDLYTWGWNVNGQLGLPTHENIDLKYENGRTEILRKKLPSVFPIPRLIDLPKSTDSGPLPSDGDSEDLDDQYNASKVSAGARHTVVKTDSGTILGSGWNSYGQLGIQDVDNDVTRFLKILINNGDDKDFDVTCGEWCTVVLPRLNEIN